VSRVAQQKGNHKGRNAGEARDLLQKNAMFKNPAIVGTLAWSDYRLEDLEGRLNSITSIRLLAARSNGNERGHTDW
jgi:hypothetical protein